MIYPLKYVVGASFLCLILCALPFRYSSGKDLHADDIIFLQQPQFYIDSLATIKVDAIPNKQFYSFSYYFRETPHTLPTNKNIWIRYVVLNESKHDSLVYFYAGSQQLMQAFLEIGGRAKPFGSTGTFVAASHLSIPGNRSAIPLRLPSNAVSTIYIKVFNYTFYHVDPFQPKLVSQRELTELVYRSKQLHSSHDTKYAFCFGIFVIMFFYVLIKFIYIRDKSYLWYALSILCSFAYFLLNYLHQPFHDYIFNENPFLLHIITDPVIIIQIVCYIFFTTEFLYLKKTDRFFYNLLIGLSVVLTAYTIIGTFYEYVTKDMNGRIAIDKLFGILICLTSVFGVYRIYAIKTILSRILLGGIICMIIFSILSLVVEYAREFFNFPDPAGGMFHLDLLLIGNIAEVLFFALALGYRDRLVLNEKLHFQEELVTQYERTVTLQNDYQKELEKEVEQKTQQILLNNQIVEATRTEQIKADFQRQIAELEMKALRAQMNPHFIFNCLSTIESYIYQAQPYKASKLLQKFARLTRLILENSRLAFNTVWKESEALKLYIELERERSNESFNYSLNVDNDALALLIPPMLIQPLVENAILHGIRPLMETEGFLAITIRKENDHLYFSVEDNGIGLEKAGILKANSSLDKASHGINIIKERLAIMSKDFESNPYLKITDKKLPGSGVLAELLFPIHK